MAVSSLRPAIRRAACRTRHLRCAALVQRHMHRFATKHRLAWRLPTVRVSACVRVSERVSERALSLVRQVSVLFLMLDTVLWHGLCTSSVRHATLAAPNRARRGARSHNVCSCWHKCACRCPHSHSEGAGSQNGVRGSTHSVGWAG